MKLNKTIFLFTVLFSLVPSTVMAAEIIVTEADSVWTPELTSASSDVTDSTDAPEKNLIKWAFVSHADSVLNIGLEENGWEAPSAPTYNVAVILAETNNVPHESSPITAQPCKLLPKKTYPDGHSKKYYQDLAYCVADYYKENSFETLNLDFEIFDDNGSWFKTTKNEEDYLSDERDFVIDAINLATNKSINLSNKDIIIVVHSGTSYQNAYHWLWNRHPQKLDTLTWPPDSQPSGRPPYKIIAAEDDMVGNWSHEIGHLFGELVIPIPNSTIIPDLSHRDILMGDVEKWDLMARGSWNDDRKNPPYMSSYTKEFLQWLDYDIHPKSAYDEYWINSLETSELGDNVFRYNLSEDITDESPKYYILEARNRNLKTWDSSLPGLPIIEDKNLVLYYVDTKGLPEYGYVPEGIAGYQEGIMWNQYRTVTIPGKGSINDGILNPLFNETYRDLDNLVKFTAITDRTINDLYEIKANIEEITYDSFADKFWGVILKPSSIFEQKIKTTPALFAPLNIQLGGPLKGPVTISEAVAGIGRFILWLLLIPLILSGLLLFFLNKIIISRLKSERGKKVIKIILKILWISVLIGLIVFIICLILVPILEKIEPLPPSPCPPGVPCLPTPLSYTISPDLDLHLYCDDGKHIGMNYGIGEYEIQVPGAIVSGDNQDAPEWIFVPESITDCHYVVSSYDNQKFLEENPEIAQQIEDTTDSYEVYARYIDPAAAIYTSAIISEEIEAGEELEQPIRGTTDIFVLPAIPWITAPKQLKEEVIQKLEQARTGEKIIDREIDLVIRYLNRSLDDKLWLDASYLDPKDGQEVFHQEHMAVVHMYYKIKIFEKEISTLNKVIENKQKRGLDTSREESKLRAINIILPVFEQAIDDLVKADEILAKIILNEAKNTEVKDPKFQKIVIHQIEKAEREFTMAYEELEEDKPNEAIIRFGLVWRYSQLAIKFALNK